MHTESATPGPARRGSHHRRDPTLAAQPPHRRPPLHRLPLAAAPRRGLTDCRGSAPPGHRSSRPMPSVTGLLVNLGALRRNPNRPTVANYCDCLLQVAGRIAGDRFTTLLERGRKKAVDSRGPRFRYVELAPPHRHLVGLRNGLHQDSHLATFAALNKTSIVH